MNDKGQEVENPARRELFKKIVFGGAAIAAAKVLSACAPETETPVAENHKSGGEMISPTEGSRPNYWKGEVNDGEGLTLAAERISGVKMDNLSGFELIWEHNGVNYIFESKKAFMLQSIVPLPVVWPKDKVVLGSEDQMKDDVSEVKKLSSWQRVYLETKNHTEDKKVEQTLTVLGGRFDRPVIFKLNDEKTSWEVNPKADIWVDSGKLKEIMNANPDMKSSEAFTQL